MHQQLVAHGVEHAGGTIAARCQAQIDPKVQAAVTEAFDTFCAGDVCQRKQAGGAFNQRPHGQAGAVRLGHLCRGFCFRQHQCTQARVFTAERDVVREPGCVTGVHAHGDAAVRLLAQKGGQCRPGAVFVFRRDGIFQVHDHAVRTAGQRTRNPFRAAGGDKQC